MKKTLIIFLLLLFWACKEKKSETEIEELSQSQSESSVSLAQRIPEINEATKTQLLRLQNKIKQNPADRELIEAYCKTAQAGADIIITVGSGLLVNPQTGDAIARPMAERAARMDATRWAFYADTWLRNDYQPAFGQIQGQFTKQTEIALTEVSGDTLHIFLAAEF